MLTVRSSEFKLLEWRCSNMRQTEVKIISYSRTLLRSLSRDQRIRDSLRGKLIKSNRILGL
jgi:hypothetical protein